MSQEKYIGMDDLLKPQVSRLVVCDPRKAALLKEGNKSDRIDARKLAECYARTSAQPCTTKSMEYAL